MNRIKQDVGARFLNYLEILGVRAVSLETHRLENSLQE